MASPVLQGTASVSFSFWRTPLGAPGAQNKKEVKTASFSPPGVGGVLHDRTLGSSAGLPCQAGLRPHSRTAFSNSIGDSPPESLSFTGFYPPTALLPPPKISP